jgi:hypothetical protein
MTCSSRNIDKHFSTAVELHGNHMLYMCGNAVSVEILSTRKMKNLWLQFNFSQIDFALLTFHSQARQSPPRNA